MPAEWNGKQIELVLSLIHISLGGLTKEKHDAYMNYWSVKALLSRVYLYMNDNENALKCAEAVSYTHLDVYKRQTFKRAVYLSRLEFSTKPS